jgi:hypothetical protein
MPHQLQQQAVVWLGSINDGPAVATGGEPGLGVEPQAAFGHVAGMAFKAVLNEQRPNPRFEEILRRHRGREREP